MNTICVMWDAFVAENRNVTSAYSSYSGAAGGSKPVLVPPTVVTHNAVTFTVEKTNDRFQTLGKKSKSTNGGQVGGHLVKQTVNEPKASTSVPKKGATNLGNASKSSSMLKNQPLKATVPSTKVEVRLLSRLLLVSWFR
ncbi:hypothetical protein Tco_0572741 [Tanacetum coccineum]